MKVGEEREGKTKLKEMEWKYGKVEEEREGSKERKDMVEDR
jgi:hypothetical protein